MTSRHSQIDAWVTPCSGFWQKEVKNRERRMNWKMYRICIKSNAYHKSVILRITSFVPFAPRYLNFNLFLLTFNISFHSHSSRAEVRLFVWFPKNYIYFIRFSLSWTKWIRWFLSAIDLFISFWTEIVSEREANTKKKHFFFISFQRNDVKSIRMKLNSA